MSEYRFKFRERDAVHVREHVYVADDREATMITQPTTPVVCVGTSAKVKTIIYLNARIPVRVCMCIFLPWFNVLITAGLSQSLAEVLDELSFALQDIYPLPPSSPPSTATWIAKRFNPKSFSSRRYHSRVHSRELPKHGSKEDRP